MDPSLPIVSLVIPAWNEAAYLPRLLDSVDVARARFAHGADAVEVVVADNGSSDDTARIAHERGCRVAHVEKRVIAAARNGGAAIARGRLLAFIDADSTIHRDTFDAIVHTLADERWIAGMSGVTMDRWSLPLVLTFGAMQPLAWLAGMDTGVVYCRRMDFVQCGGYPETREFAEDVAFLLALRRLGRMRGQRLRRTPWIRAVTSTRKFDRFGDWHMLTFTLRAGLARLRSREAFVEVTRDYWYRGR